MIKHLFHIEITKCLKNGFESDINHLELLKFVPKNEARFQKCQNFKTNSERELRIFYQKRRNDFFW